MQRIVNDTFYTTKTSETRKWMVGKTHNIRLKAIVPQCSRISETGEGEDHRDLREGIHSITLTLERGWGCYHSEAREFCWRRREVRETR
jgi:hypothetical protein